MLRGTPFHSRTSALCEGQNWRRWAGYVVAGSYELTHEREYHAIRNSAALIDISPLHKYRITWPDAARLLDRMVTRDVSKCAVGQVLYTPWCDEAGKVIDDGTIARLEPLTFRLTAADPSLLWLEENSTGLHATVEDISEAIAALALQGPEARAILEEATGLSLSELKYFRLTATRIGEVPVTISRTGYTGDLGYEIWVEAESAESVWDALINAGATHGITPAGMLALDLARIEAGLLLIEVDYVSAHKALIEQQKSSPFELGLGWAVKLEKENFVGRRALMEEKLRGPAWQFVGVEIGWQSLERRYGEAGLPPQVPSAAWRTSVPLYSNGTQVGYASSGGWSPLLKRTIALAHVQSRYARVGTPLQIEVTVEHQRKQAEARVVETPFYSPARKKA